MLGAVRTEPRVPGTESGLDRECAVRHGDVGYWVCSVGAASCPLPAPPGSGLDHDPPAPPRPPARPGTAPVLPAEPARIGPAWRGRGAPCSTSPPPAACFAPCQVPGRPPRGAGAGRDNRGIPPVSPRRGAQSRDSRRGSAGTRAPPPADGAAGEESGELPPPSRAPPPRSSAPGLPPELGRDAPGPGRRRAGEVAQGCSGGSRVSPALRAAARPPVPALPIQGSCRQRCSRRRSLPGSPPARRDPEGMCGEGSSDPGGARLRYPALRAARLPPCRSRVPASRCCCC